MSKIIITGATGNAGSAILDAALASPQVAQVTVLSRRPPFVEHAKLRTIILPSPEYPKGFDEIPPSLVEKMEGYTAVIWALGVSQNDVSKEEYIKITHDYTVTAAKAFSSLGTPTDPLRFIFISGTGTDQTEQSRVLYAKVKGKVENALNAAQTPSFQTISLRPSVIGYTREFAPRVPMTRRAYHAPLLALGRIFYPAGIIESPDLAAVALQLAAGKGWDRKTDKGIIENRALREMAAVYKQMRD